MKKIYNLMAFAALVAAGFTSCKPLDKTFDGIGPKPVAIVPPSAANYTLTLTDAEYAMLPPSDAAYAQKLYQNSAAAYASIPAILAKKYSTAPDKSTAAVTYATSPIVPVITLADKTNANVSITLQTGNTPSDYKFSAFTYTPAVGANISVAAVTFEDLGAAQAISWLRNRFKVAAATTPVTYTPTLPNNSIIVLTYLYFESNVTPSSGALTTDAFLYTTANDWVKIYRVSNAQYASVNRGTNNLFLAADAPNLPSYFNTFLKNDATIMLTAKVGDVQYVNYKLGTSTVYTQEVMPLAYDGVNWVATTTTATTTFVKSGSTWSVQLDNTVFITLKTADYAAIANLTTTGAPATVLANLKSFSNFNIEGGSASTTRWTDAQIASGVISILTTPLYTANAALNQKFVVTEAIHGGLPTQTQTFNWDGTKFVYLATPDNSKYTLTGDDYTAITAATSTNTATAAAKTNLDSFGDFSLSGATAWTQDQINQGVSATLKVRYPAATATTTIAVTYYIYNGGNTFTTKSYKYDGTNWIMQ